MTRLTLRLRDHTSVASAGGQVTIHHPWGSLVVAGPAWLDGVLHGLGQSELDTDDILDALIEGGIADEAGVAAALSELEEILARMPMVVQRSVYDAGSEELRLIPISSAAPAAFASELPESWIVSTDRHTYLRRHPGEAGLMLESPLAHHRALVGSRLVALLGLAASEPLEVADLDAGADRVAISLLVSVGLLRAGPPGAAEGPESTWSFHDLLFHARSRQGRSDEAFGAFASHSAQAPPPPAVLERAPTAFTQLHVPRFEDVLDADAKLTEVMESRRSVRDYADDAVTVEELGELLYRAARTRAIAPVPNLGGFLGIDHPYPTGGMAGDLDIYVTAANCAGIEEGAYYYNPNAHQLEWVSSIDGAAPLLLAARIACGGELEPQVLLTFTSRFARLSWKYDSIAYALTLKHVGVLMQTIYLVATSMGLAPCALGSGDADASARVLGLNWLEESSVGEMLIGRPAEPTPASHTFRDVRGG